MTQSRSKYGIVIEAVLVTDIELPNENLDKLLKIKLNRSKLPLQAQFEYRKTKKRAKF
jgi:hypothetical protein